MPEFEISLVRSEYPPNSITLMFRSEQKIRLTAKSITFYPAPPTKVVQIIPIFLGEKDKCCTFHYPDPNVTYERLSFDLRQEGCKGWHVSVDLTKREICIKESEYQIL